MPTKFLWLWNACLLLIHLTTSGPSLATSGLAGEFLRVHSKKPVSTHNEPRTPVAQGPDAVHVVMVCADAGSGTRTQPESSGEARPAVAPLTFFNRNSPLPQFKTLSRITRYILLSCLFCHLYSGGVLALFGL